MGRPPMEPTQEIMDRICEQLSDGKSLRKICLADDMPGQTTVFKWLANDESFAKQYAHAREAQADAIFDECLDIADDATNDFMDDKDGKDGEYNGDHVQRTRIRIDTRKWMAGKLRPKKYGDAMLHKHADAEGEKIALGEVESLTRLAALASKLQERLGDTNDTE